MRLERVLKMAASFVPYAFWLLKPVLSLEMQIAVFPIIEFSNPKANSGNINGFIIIRLLFCPHRFP